MRRYIRPAGWWVLVSTGGWWLATNIRLLLGGVLDPLVQQLWHRYGLWEVFWINLVKEPVNLAIFSAVQGLVLPGNFWPASLWVLASTVGGAVKGVVSSAICAAVCRSVAIATATVGWNGQVATSALSYSAGWAGYGVVTGLVLAWLLQQRYRH